MPRIGMGSTLHEYILGLLFELGRNMGLIPLPEYQPNRKNKQRIDIVWFSKSGIIDAVFEVDKTIYPKSIKKLLTLNQSCKKYIVAMGLGKKPLPVYLLEGKEIYLLDLTQNKLGIYGDFR